MAPLFLCCFMDAYPLPLAHCEVLLSGGLVNVEPPQPPTGQSRGNDFRVYAKDFRLLQRCLDPWLEYDQIFFQTSRIETCETCDVGLWHLTVRSTPRDSLQGEKMQGFVPHNPRKTHHPMEHCDCNEISRTNPGQ